MKKNKLLIILATLTLICIFSVAALADGCGCRALITEEAGVADGEKEEEPPEKESEELPEEEPEPQPDAVEYGTAFGIDYDNPDKYLSQGEQSKISDTKALEKLYSEKKTWTTFAVYIIGLSVSFLPSQPGAAILVW